MVQILPEPKNTLSYAFRDTGKNLLAGFEDVRAKNRQQTQNEAFAKSLGLKVEDLEAFGNLSEKQAEFTGKLLYNQRLQQDYTNAYNCAKNPNVVETEQVNRVNNTATSPAPPLMNVINGNTGAQQNPQQPALNSLGQQSPPLTNQLTANNVAPPMMQPQQFQQSPQQGNQLVPDNSNWQPPQATNLLNNLLRLRVPLDQAEKIVSMEEKAKPKKGEKPLPIPEQYVTPEIFGRMSPDDQENYINIKNAQKEMFGLPKEWKTKRDKIKAEVNTAEAKLDSIKLLNSGLEKAQWNDFASFVRRWSDEGGVGANLLDRVYKYGEGKAFKTALLPQYGMVKELVGGKPAVVEWKEIIDTLPDPKNPKSANQAAIKNMEYPAKIKVLEGKAANIASNWALQNNIRDVDQIEEYKDKVFRKEKEKFQDFFQRDMTATLNEEPIKTKPGTYKIISNGETYIDKTKKDLARYKQAGIEYEIVYDKKKSRNRVSGWGGLAGIYQDLTREQDNRQNGEL